MHIITHTITMTTSKMTATVIIAMASPEHMKGLVIAIVPITNRPAIPSLLAAVLFLCTCITLHI